ncbi:MAG: hypothetical protein Kilf2KO_15190 [Rhodospirillales bacterium]
MTKSSAAKRTGSTGRKGKVEREQIGLETASFIASSTVAVAATAQVLAWRLPLLALSCVHPTPARKREGARMLQEKQIAFAMGLAHVQAELLRQSLTWWTGSPSSRKAAGGPTSLANAFLAPAYRTVGANARRLNRRKRI